MTESKRFVPLKLKFLGLLLAAAILGVGVYFVCNNVGYGIVETGYMSQDSSAARVRLYTAKFQSYVRQNNISSRDLDAVAAWTQENKYVHILIFQDQQARAEAGSWGASSLIGSQYEKYYEAVSGSYSFTPVKFSDGTFRVTLDEYSYTKYYTLCDIISLILAFVVMLALVLAYIGRLTNRIRKLSVAAQEIENGNLEYAIPIPVNASDEVTRLASGMNSMRLSVQERIESESAARQANVGLITAMSHDLRTPLTTLIGYLELLQNGVYQNDAQRAEYTSIAHEKAMRLKELTDELFRYFLVFDRSDIPANIEEFDAQILMEQLLSEHIIELKSEGRRVIVNTLSDQCTILADVMCLKRVFDNIFSNVRKHSAVDGAVIVMAQIEDDGRLHISVTNSVPPVPNKVESTRIGLKTCEKMMKATGGGFKTVTEEGKFMAEVIVPVKK